MAKIKAPIAMNRQPIVFVRADPALLAQFDPKTKVCMMNCGQSKLDPRSRDEMKFLCDDCIERSAT